MSIDSSRIVIISQKFENNKEPNLKRKKSAQHFAIVIFNNENFEPQKHLRVQTYVCIEHLSEILWISCTTAR